MKPYGPALLALGLLLAGCGQNGATAPQKVTLTAVNAAGQPADPLAAAYHVGDQAWRWLPYDGGYTFDLPAGETRYGVAVLCPAYSEDYAWGTVVMAELSLADTAAPVLTCPDNPFERMTARGQADVSGVTGARSFFVDAFHSHDAGYSATDDYQVGLLPGADRALLFLAYATTNPYSADPPDLLAARVFHGLDARDDLTQDLRLTDADAPSRQDVHAFDVPVGWSGGFTVSFLSRHGVLSSRWLGEGDAGGGTYRTVAGVVEGDFYTLSAGAYWLEDPLEYTVEDIVYLPAPGSGAADASLPAPLPAGYTLDTSTARPAFALTHPGPGLAGYRIELEGTSSDPRWRIWVSQTWLEQRDRYTPPDFSGVPAFEALQRATRIADWSLCALLGEAPWPVLLGGPTYEGLPALPQEPFELKRACVATGHG